MHMHRLHLNTVNEGFGDHTVPECATFLPSGHLLCTNMQRFCISTWWKCYLKHSKVFKSNVSHCQQTLSCVILLAPPWSSSHLLHVFGLSKKWEVAVLLLTEITTLCVVGDNYICYKRLSYWLIIHIHTLGSVEKLGAALQGLTWKESYSNKT